MHRYIFPVILMVLAVTTASGCDSQSSPTTATAQARAEPGGSVASPDTNPLPIGSAVDAPSSENPANSQTSEEQLVEMPDSDADGFSDDEDLFPADPQQPEYTTENNHRLVTPPQDAESKQIVAPLRTEPELTFRTDTVEKRTPFKVGYIPDIDGNPYHTDYDFVLMYFPLNGPNVDGKLPESKLEMIQTQLDQVGGQNLDLVLRPDTYASNHQPGHFVQSLLLSKELLEGEGHNVVAVMTTNSTGHGYKTAESYRDAVQHLKSSPGSSELPLIGPCARGFFDDISDVAELYKIASEYIDGICGSHPWLLSKYGKTWDFDPDIDLMAAIKGAEHGLDAGTALFFLATTEIDMANAFDGTRLGYAESDSTLAAVYRSNNGKVQLFAQSHDDSDSTSGLRVTALDRPVSFGGSLPNREYYLPSDKLASRYGQVIDISWGEDAVWVPTEGPYSIVNKSSGLVLSLESDSTTNGTNVVQSQSTNLQNQIWKVSYSEWDDTVALTNAQNDAESSAVPKGWNIDTGTNVHIWKTSSPHEWNLIYNGGTWFHICARNTNQCLDIQNGSTGDGTNVFLWQKQSNESQLWSFVPASAGMNQEALEAPNVLTAFANPESVILRWSPTQDAVTFNILRADAEDGKYNTIARNIASNSFVDNDIVSGTSYLYKVQAEKLPLLSSYSNEVRTKPADGNTLVAHYNFNATTEDQSINFNHAAGYTTPEYTDGISGEAISLNGEQYLQLPYAVGKQEAMTVSTWVYWEGGDPWQRIFDFGASENNHMFLTPRSADGLLQLKIKDGEKSYSLIAGSIPVQQWTHVVVTMEDQAARLYVNGELKHESLNVDFSSTTLKSTLNYIGRSQYLTDPLFKGKIDEFRIYNHAITAEETAQLYLSGANINAATNGRENELENESGTTIAENSPATTFSEILSAEELLNSNTDDHTPLPVISELPEIRIRPSSPTVENTIRAKHEFLNYGDFSYSYRWTINGNVVALTTDNNLDQPFKRGDVISVELLVSKGNSTVSRASEPVEVANARPELLNLELLPENATNIDDIRLEFDAATDADGDTIEITYHWYTGYDDEPLGITTSSLDSSFLREADADTVVEGRVTVSDGIHSDTYSRTWSHEKHPVWFYKEQFQNEIAYSELTEFTVGFIDKNGNTYDAALYAGPDGLALKDGTVTWTPSHTMLAEEETHHVYFKSPFGQVASVSILIKNNEYAKWRKIEHDTLYQPQDSISIAGWANVGNNNTELAFVVANTATNGQSIGRIINDDTIVLTQLPNEWGRPLNNAPTIANIVDSNDDGIDEIALTSSRNGIPAIQIRKLEDTSLQNSIELTPPQLNELFTWDSTRDEASFLPDEKILFITGFTDINSPGTSDDFAFTTLTKWRNRHYPITSRLHLYDSETSSFRHTEIDTSQYEVNVFNLNTDSTSHFVTQDIEQIFDVLGSWTLGESGFTYTENEHYARCTLTHHLESEGKFLCVEVQTGGHCQAFCYGSYAYANLYVFNSDLKLLNKSELWGEECHDDTGCNIVVSYSDSFQDISLPEVIAPLNTKQLIVLDTANRLIQVSINTGRILSVQTDPVLEKITDIHCQTNATSIEQCVFLGEDNIIYRYR